MIDLSQTIENLRELFGMELDERLASAVSEIGRERFASRVYDDRRKEWVGNNQNGRWTELLSEDRFLPIQEEDGVVTSSISQPSLVFAMIQHLDVQPGHRVLEIGAASGWSAALMSALAGPAGEIVSVEIDAELVEMAKANVEANRLGNVRVVEGDGLAGVLGKQPFDRIVYTVGARDFPDALLDLVVPGGKVVLVHKIDAMADILYSGFRTDRGIELQPIMPVLFVELRGSLEGEDQFVDLEPLPENSHKLPFWGDVSGYVDLLYRTAGLRFYLRMRSPDYHLVKLGELTGFGLLASKGGRAVALKGTNVVQGDSRTIKSFEQMVRDWTSAGLPGLTAFDLTIARPDGTEEKPFQVRGRDLVYIYRPRNAVTSGGVQARDNVVPLRAAAN